MGPESRMAAVSQLWDFDKKEWMSPELISSHGWDDDGIARLIAEKEASSRLNELIAQRRLPSDRCTLEFPWLERILVCPLLPGLGLGGSDYFEVNDRSFTLTVGLE